MKKAGMYGCMLRDDGYARMYVYFQNADLRSIQRRLPRYADAA